jgi:hypothetical protein
MGPWAWSRSFETYVTNIELYPGDLSALRNRQLIKPTPTDKYVNKAPRPTSQSGCGEPAILACPSASFFIPFWQFIVTMAKSAQNAHPINTSECEEQRTPLSDLWSDVAHMKITVTIISCGGILLAVAERSKVVECSRHSGDCGVGCGSGGCGPFSV